MSFPGFGTLVNAGAIGLGTLLGLGFGSVIPQRIRSTAMIAIGLAVLALGLQMAVDPRVAQARIPYAGVLPYHPNPLVVIGGLVGGSILGSFLHLEQRLEGFGRWLQAGRAPVPDREPSAGSGPNLAEAFVTATLLVCVGAMSVIGAIEDASGQPHVLFVKSMLDGLTAIMLATTLGIGVALSAIPVLLYQGGMTLAAGSVQRFLTLPVLSTLTATGGLLLAAIGLDLTGIKRLPVGNMIPGLFLAAGLAYFFG